jgi:murein DD-endopeptidase MepM/ murein hydrolase activator NlpD
MSQIDQLSFGRMMVNHNMPQEQKIDAAGEKFEGYMLQMMVREMRKTVPKGMFDSPAMKIFMDLFDQAIAEELAVKGGLGFTDALRQDLMSDEAGKLGENALSHMSGFDPTSLDNESAFPGFSGDLTSNLSMDTERFREIVEYGRKFVGHLPVDGSVSSSYGLRMHPILKEHRHHDGIDIRAAKGTPIRPVASGVVKSAENSGSYGNLIVIDHGDGWTSRYAHCDSINVQLGQPVTRDLEIGTVGATGRTTGPHLHLEIRKDGKPVDPSSLIKGLQK